jgi:ribonuclease HI
MRRYKKGMPEKCLETTSLMKELGFMINVEKSVLVPQKQITFLGNIIDSDQMIVIIPTEKQEIIVNECKKLFKRDKDTIRNVAKVIGLIVSTFSAVQYGKLHYRQLEQGKILALKRFKGNYDTYMTITLEMKEELAWWFTNIYIQKRDISHGVPEKILNTDASLQGWGAVMLSEKIGGRWTQSESLKHINYLEILAIYYALQAFHDLVKNTHIKILTDNSTAVSYINNMGGVKSDDCNLISKKIWIWCIKHNIWISCSHIAGKKNIEADKKSRIFNDDLEWQLNLIFFSKYCRKMGQTRH